MKVLILGGSASHPGGVEAFCERAKLAIGRESGVEIDRLPTDTAYVKLHQFPKVLKGLLRLIRHRDRPDVIWLQYVNLADLGYLLVASLLGRRVMVTPHLGLNWRSQSSPVLRNLSCWIIGKADRLALISKTQEQEIKLPPRVPRSAVRNFLPPTVGLNEVTPRAERAGGALRLLHAGRLSEGKGTLRFIEVCRSLARLGVPFSARIAGSPEGDTGAQMAEAIAAGGLEDKVSVLGRVSDAELLDLLRTSDVLVHLSAIDSYPLIVLECLAFGAFPLCMDLAGARDMIETYDGKVVSIPGAVAESVAFLKDQDPDALRARTLAAGARMRADYAWSNCARLARAALEATARPRAV